MQIKLTGMRLTQETLLSAINEFETLEIRIVAVPAVTAVPEPNKAFNRVDAITLVNVVSLDLDVAHFTKLIPRKERAKGQANAGMTSGVHLTVRLPQKGKLSLINERNVPYEKHFPDYAMLVNVLTNRFRMRNYSIHSSTRNLDKTNDPSLYPTSLPTPTNINR